MTLGCGCKVGWFTGLVMRFALAIEYTFLFDTLHAVAWEKKKRESAKCA